MSKINNNKCIICGHEMRFHFQKDFFTNANFAKMADSIVPVQYYECSQCGFLSSITHKNLLPEKWIKLNDDFHHYNEMENRAGIGINQPPYAEQAMMLEILIRNNIIDGNDILDYAAGYGSLSRILKKYYGRKINCYDKYVTDASFNYIDEINGSTWSVIINSAMFEHVLNRNDLDDVNNLVSDNGALLIHTVVVDFIPKDPSWFYIDIPVHTAVHTNRSMSILMEQWNYKSSIYSPRSKTWVLLKKPYKDVKPIIDNINKELQTEWLYGKDGFMDYWKAN